MFEDIDGVVYMLGRRCLILPSMFISDLQIAVRVRLRVRVFHTKHAVWRRFGGRKFSKCACSELKTRTRSRPCFPILRSLMSLA